MKTCSICKIEKDKKKFWKSKQQRDGFRCACIDCLKKKNNEYSKKNRKKLIEYQRKYYKKNRDKVLSYCKNYRENNPEKVKSSQLRTYYSRDEECVNRKRENSRRFRKTEKYKKWQQSYKKIDLEKQKCRWELCNAIRDGKIFRSEICEMCHQKRKTDGHHSDYSKPLQVQWVCRKCHMAIHKSLKLRKKLCK